MVANPSPPCLFTLWIKNLVLPKQSLSQAKSSSSQTNRHLQFHSMTLTSCRDQTKLLHKSFSPVNYTHLGTLQGREFFFFFKRRNHQSHFTEREDKVKIFHCHASKGSDLYLLSNVTSWSIFQHQKYLNIGNILTPRFKSTQATPFFVGLQVLKMLILVVSWHDVNIMLEKKTLRKVFLFLSRLWFIFISSPSFKLASLCAQCCRTVYKGGFVCHFSSNSDFSFTPPTRGKEI